MTVPEQERPSDRVPIETKRVFIYADEFARAQNTNIGIGQLFSGVLHEMGKLFAITVLRRNGIEKTNFIQGLQLAIRFDDVKKYNKSVGPGLTPLVKTAIEYAMKHTASKNIPEFSPSDLLLGIAKAAAEAAELSKRDDELRAEVSAKKLMSLLEEERTNLTHQLPKKNIFPDINLLLKKDILPSLK